MKFGIDEIITVIDKVKSTELSSFEYQDADTKIKIKGSTGSSGTGRQAAECVDMGAISQEKSENEKKQCEHGAEEEIPPTVHSQQARSTENSGKSAADASQIPEDAGNCEVVLSPMVGTFYTAPAENAEPFIHVGDTIQRGQVVGIVEAMKLMNEIEAECGGIVEAILAENEQMVEFGQPLIRVRKL